MRTFINGSFPSFLNFPNMTQQTEEEARQLQKKIQTVENELDSTQEALTQVNTKLEEKNKALQNVSIPIQFFHLDLLIFYTRNVKVLNIKKLKEIQVSIGEESNFM